MFNPSQPTALEQAVTQAANRAAFHAGAFRLSGVRSAQMRWLWPGRIPLGRVTLLAGDPGAGKSIVMLDLAARVTSGAPWPDEPGDTPLRSPGSAVLVTAEDDPADTIRPRFEAMGGVAQRIFVLPSSPDQELELLCATEGIRPKQRPTRHFDLARDVPTLRSFVKAVGDCRLVVIDPITACLGETSENVGSNVRQLLLPLLSLARECQLALVIVNHLRKRDGAAVYRTMGSMAYVAASRAAWALTRDPKNPQRRLFVPVKSNFASDTTGLALTIASDTPKATPVVRWFPEKLPMTADIAIGSIRGRGRPDDQMKAAMEWLQKTLADGPQPSRDLQQTAEHFGYGLRTLQRAFRELDGRAFREKSLGEWYWALPVLDRQK